MILAGVLLVLFLLGQVRVGLRGEYTASGLKVWARLGALKIQLLPWRKKKPAREKKPLPKPVQKGKEKPKTLPGGALDYARELLPLALEAAGRFRRKPTIFRNISGESSGVGPRDWEKNRRPYRRESSEPHQGDIQGALPLDHFCILFLREKDVPAPA